MASIASGTYASGNLRSPTIDIDHVEDDMLLTPPLVHMKGKANENRILGEGSDERVRDEIHEEKKRQATKEKKYQQMHTVVDETTISTHLDSESTESIPKDGESNPDLGIKIVGGEMSDENEFPYYGRFCHLSRESASSFCSTVIYVSRIFRAQNNIPFSSYPCLFSVDMNGCGGTLIGPRVILSAAHCGSYVGTKVKMGKKSYEVVQERLHPKYDDTTIENDFALFKLKSSVPTTDTGIRLTLNTNSSIPSAGKSLTVLGLGITSEGGSAPWKLRDVVVPAVSNPDCRSAYGTGFVPRVMFCAGKEGKDSCAGDSGGPIVLRKGTTDHHHILTGVVSWGNGCGRPGFPGVYARVSAIIPWIQNVACKNWNSAVNGLCDTPSSPNNPVDTPNPPPDDCTTLKVILHTDDWPEESSIVLENDQRTIWNYDSFTSNRRYVYNRCLPTNGCTVLDVTDTEGDGLWGDGNIKVIWGSQVLYDDSDIGYGFYLNVGNGC